MIAFMFRIIVASLLATSAALASPTKRGALNQTDNFSLIIRAPGTTLDSLWLTLTSYKLDVYNLTDIRVFTPQTTYNVPMEFSFIGVGKTPTAQLLYYQDLDDPILNEPTDFYAAFRVGEKPGVLFMSSEENGGEKFTDEKSLSFNKKRELMLNGDPDVWYICTVTVPGDQGYDKKVKPVPHKVRVLTTNSVIVEQDCVHVKVGM